MKITNNKILQNWIIILLIMITGFILIGLYILISGNILTKRATDSFYDYNLNEKKQQAIIEVTNRLDEINFERADMLDNNKVNLKNDVSHISSHISSSNLTREQSISFIEQEISPDSFYNYFIMSGDGTMIKTNAPNFTFEISFMIRLLESKKRPEGVFLDYNWPQKRTIFCKYMPDFDYMICLGVKHTDIQEQLQEKIYSRLQSYYEEKDNYIFVTEYDSTARVSANPNLIGQKMNQITSFEGNSIHLQFMDVMDRGTDGFVTYKYYKRGSDILSEKMTYVHKLEDWNAYIGMGFHLDDLQKEVVSYSEIFQRHYYNQALYIVLGLTLLSLIVYAVFQRGAYMQKMLMRQGDIIYDKLFELSNDAIVVISDKDSLLYENPIAEKLFKKRSLKYLKQDSTLLLSVEDDIYTFFLQNGRQYFIKLRTESATYNNKESRIYFVSDITKEYIQSHKLEQLAYIDELTRLPNRRSLIDDFDDIKHNYNPESSYILGMLDIDHFKIVNDTHGHNIGDLVLKEISNTFRSTLRHNDKLYRYGGEEFVIILSEINLKKAKDVIEKIDINFNKAVSETLGFKCTFSCGLIQLTDRTVQYTLEELILRADELLYRAKNQGRNRVEI